MAEVHVGYVGKKVFPRKMIHDKKGRLKFPKQEPGVVVGTRHCQLEGCRGLCLIVRWPSGKRTMPCTKGMEEKRNGWHII